MDAQDHNSEGGAPMSAERGSMSHTALLPCPFCTSEAELCCALTGDWKSAIRCSSCGAKTGWKPDDEAAIDAWNTRHDSQRVAALEEALRAVTPPVDAWWCPTCHRVADQHEVTFEEYHETCGTSLREINTPEWVIKARKALEGK